MQIYLGEFRQIITIDYLVAWNLGGLNATILRPDGAHV